MISLEKMNSTDITHIPDSVVAFVRRILSEKGGTLHALPVLGSSFQSFTDSNLKVWRLIKGLRDIEADKESLKQALSSPEYSPRPFDEPAPFIDKFRDEITAEAEKAIGHFLVRNREQKVQEYINEKLERTYSEAVKTWNEKKEAHEKAQLKLQQEYHDSKARKVAELNYFLYPEENALLRNIQSDCMSCGLPFDANLEINTDEGNIACFAVSAPNPDIIPERKEYTHSRGVGYKDKTKTEINYDYISVISGMGYLFASIMFNASAKIDKVFAICTRPAFNSSKATISLECLYSVLFDRNTFAWVTEDLRFLPFENLAFFPHSVNLDHLSAPHDTNPFELKDPYGRPAGATPFMSSEPISILAGTSDLGQVDEMFADAARLVVSHQKGSTSLIQRTLALGFSRAGRIMDQLEQAGIVGPQIGSSSRQVLVANLDDLEKILEVF